MLVQILMVYCRDIKLIIGPPKVYWLFMSERYRMDEVNYSLSKKYPGLSD